MLFHDPPFFNCHDLKKKAVESQLSMLFLNLKKKMESPDHLKAGLFNSVSLPLLSPFQERGGRGLKITYSLSVWYLCMR